MDNPFFEQPILNSPYAGPSRHWELDAQGQPTQKIIQTRRPAEFITPIPQPKKRKGQPQQQDLLFDEGQGLSSQDQRYAQPPSSTACGSKSTAGVCCPSTNGA